MMGVHHPVVGTRVRWSPDGRCGPVYRDGAWVGYVEQHADEWRIWRRGSGWDGEARHREAAVKEAAS